MCTADAAAGQPDGVRANAQLEATITKLRESAVLAYEQMLTQDT